MSSIKVAFFTEAGSKRGMGHLVRCDTIADAFKAEGFEVNFFLDSDIDFSDKFQDITPFKWSSFKVDKQYDVIFIDSYEADLEIYNTISQICKVAVYIDDYRRLDYPKGSILNFAPDADALFFRQKNHHNQYLLGLDYVPIRKQFFVQKKLKEDQLIIMLGGFGPTDLYVEIVKSLDCLELKIIVVTHNGSVAEKLSEFDTINVLFKPTDVELIMQMSKSSFAISTASMSLYELAYYSIPTVIVAKNKHQKTGASQLINHKLACAFLDITNINWRNQLPIILNKMIKNNKMMSEQRINGLGANRIVSEIYTMVCS